MGADKTYGFINRPATAILMGILLLCMTAQGQSLRYLIAATPGNFIIYDRYQQRLSPQERTKRFASFQPLLIEDDATMLSDGFTPCLRVRSGRETYFILKTDDDAPQNAELAGGWMILDNCTLLADTVVALQDGGIRMAAALSPATATAGQLHDLSQDQQLYRLFSHQRKVFALRAGRPAVYGWAFLENSRQGSEWAFFHGKNIRTTRPTATLSDILVDINNQTMPINRLLESLFYALNDQSGQSRTPPRWRVTPEGKDTIAIRLTDTGSIPANAFPETHRYLQLRLENLAVGTGFRLSSNSTEFLLSR